jgi:hypothetical protein
MTVAESNHERKAPAMGLRARFPWKAGLGALGIYLLDAFVMNQGVVAALCAIVVFGVDVPRALFALSRNDRPSTCPARSTSPFR